MTLERVEMAPFIFKRCDTLSGGQQQRVAIARALVQEPTILLADEPIASLDPPSAARVMEILRTINRDDGITVICNLHTLDTARTYCDRLIGHAHGQDRLRRPARTRSTRAASGRSTDRRASVRSTQRRRRPTPRSAPPSLGTSTTAEQT